MSIAVRALFLIILFSGNYRPSASTKVWLGELSMLWYHYHFHEAYEWQNRERNVCIPDVGGNVAGIVVGALTALTL